MDGSNSSGTLEFSLGAVSHDMFFPISARFTAPSTYCDIQILGVTSTETEQNVKFSKQVTLKVMSLQCTSAPLHVSADRSPYRWTTTPLSRASEWPSSQETYP